MVTDLSFEYRLPAHKRGATTASVPLFPDFGDGHPKLGQRGGEHWVVWRTGGA
jgi:hypothetical protein